jgi:hypothetical protein
VKPIFSFVVASFFAVTTYSVSQDAGAVVGGKEAPNGTEIQIDLPGKEHRKNISSQGQGCCTQTSMHHSAVYQNVPVLMEFHEWVKKKGLPGGSYPSEMKKRIAMIAKDRGLPEPNYIQVEGGRELLDVLKAACASGRMPGVTYSRSPTKRYGGGQISHMVSLVHLDDTHAAILDNNYPGDSQYEWMSVDEFVATFTGGRAGWAVILLDSGPPPLPWNQLLKEVP